MTTSEMSLVFTSGPSGRKGSMSTHSFQSQRSYSSDWNDRRSSSTASVSSFSTSSSSRLRLADVAKQHGLGVHVENWREDQLPVRQYLPMQHIIGSLKRDRDEKVQYRMEASSEASSIDNRRKRAREIAAMSPRSDDSFLEMLRSPKRRRTSGFSSTDSQSTTNSDPDRRFSYQATEHVAKEISRAALPGLNMALNLATLTAVERDIFSEYAPKHLEDPQILMNEVLQLRENMMDEDYTEDTDELTDDTNDDDFHGSDNQSCASPILPAEREAEVYKAFEDFVDFGDNNRFVARI